MQIRLNGKLCFSPNNCHLCNDYLKNRKFTDLYGEDEYYMDFKLNKITSEILINFSFFRLVVVNEDVHVMNNILMIHHKLRKLFNNNKLLNLLQN